MALHHAGKPGSGSSRYLLALSRAGAVLCAVGHPRLCRNRAPLAAEARAIINSIVNELEVRVYGLQRSGNHAVIRWIIDQHASGPRCHLNDVQHGDHDPFLTAHETRHEGLPPDLDVEQLRSAPKRLLLVSYEDTRSKLRDGQRYLLESLVDPGFERNRESYLGRSLHRLDLAILRDPFNFFASRLKILEKLSGFHDVQQLVENWKDVARRAIDPGEGDPVVVRFNAWRNNEAYRRELCERVRGDFSDRTLDHVPDFGGGSSFEGLRHAPLTLAEVRNKISLRAVLDPRRWRALPGYVARLRAKGAGAMDVFGRWKQMGDDPRFRGVFAEHPELLEMSEEIFGPIAGTREFVRACARGS